MQNDFENSGGILVAVGIVAAIIGAFSFFISRPPKKREPPFRHLEQLNKFPIGEQIRVYSRVGGVEVEGKLIGKGITLKNEPWYEVLDAEGKKTLFTKKEHEWTQS